MKNIARLFRLDWRRILKSPPAFLLLLALVVIPSLYCWFNVWALWDPYANTQALTVAVYSQDQPTTFNDKEIAIGDELLTQLKANDKLGWRFVDSKKQVVDGVKSGKYYAGIVVPKDFSDNLISFVNGEIKKPKLEYYVNEKINAIAPKITATGATTLQSTISEEFITTVAKTVVGAFNKAGVDLDHNLPMIRRLAALVKRTDKQLPQIEQYINEIEAVRTKMPEVKAKLEAANEMASYLPEVNAMAQKLVGANGYMPMVDAAGQLAVKVQGKLPEVRQAGSQLNAVTTNFNQLEAGLNSAITVTDKSLNVIDQVDGTLPALTSFAHNAAGAITTTKDQVLPKLEAALTVVQHATDAGLTLIQGASTSLSQDLTAIDAKLAALDGPDAAQAKAAIATTAQNIATTQGHIKTTAQDLAATLQRLQNSQANLVGHPVTALDPAIKQLDALATIAGTLEREATKLAQDAPNLSSDALRQRVAAFKRTADTFTEAATTLLNLHLADSVQQVLTRFKQTLNDAKTTLDQINQDVLPALPGLLKDTKTLLRQANTVLVKAKRELPAVKQELQDANRLLNGNMGTITNGINTTAALYQNDFPALKQKLTQATDFIQADLPGLENQLTATLTLANTKLPALQSGLDAAHDMIQHDWPTVKKAIQAGAATIDKAEASVDLNQLIKLLKRDATAESSFLAKPVELQEKALYPIPTYGSQSAPFYLALCIWVGALLLGAIIITEYHLPEELVGAVSNKQMFFSRWLTFAMLGMGQGLIAALGNIYLIHAYVVNKPLYVLFAMLLSVVFVSILYALIALFGNIGKGIGIIILVLSISGAGGNFPVVLSNPFFQAINPWLPFTYAVNILREATGGIYWPNLWSDLWHLALFGLIFFFGGLFLQEPIRPLIDKMHAISKKSQIME